MRTSLALALALTATSSACLDEATVDDESLAESTQDVLLPLYTVATSDVTGAVPLLTISAVCPANTVVLGGSFAAVDATGAYLPGVTPASSYPVRNQWSVAARNPTPGTWTLRVRAVCGAPPAGYSIISTQTVPVTTLTQQSTVPCPVGKRTLSGGFILFDNTRRQITAGEATYFMPSWDGTSWLVNASVESAKPSWSLQLYAVCADPAPIGHELVTRESALDKLVWKQVATTCPGTKAMTGAGWGVVDSTYAILQGHSTQHDVGFNGKTWTTNASNGSAFSPTWRLQQRAICVD